MDNLAEATMVDSDYSKGAVNFEQDCWDIAAPNYFRPVGTNGQQMIKLYQQNGFNADPYQDVFHFRNSDL